MTGKNGYEGIYEWVRGRLAKADGLAGRAGRLGLTLDGEGRTLVPLFGRVYVVDTSGVAPLDGLPAPVNHLSLAGHYAMSEGRGEASGEFAALHRLSSVIDQGGIFECSSMSKTLDRKFGNDLAALRRRAAQLGGAELSDEPSGGLAWLFQAFPKVPIKLIHHPADDEFGAEYKLLFDTSATAFMAFEALGFLAGAFIGEMLSGPE
jgi:hypothetical protein